MWANAEKCARSHVPSSKLQKKEAAATISWREERRRVTGHKVIVGLWKEKKEGEDVVLVMVRRAESGNFRKW